MVSLLYFLGDGESEEEMISFLMLDDYQVLRNLLGLKIEFFIRLYSTWDPNQFDFKNAIQMELRKQYFRICLEENPTAGKKFIVIKPIILNKI
jgi:hypothetical protein